MLGDASLALTIASVIAISVTVVLLIIKGLQARAIDVKLQPLFTPHAK